MFEPKDEPTEDENEGNRGTAVRGGDRVRGGGPVKRRVRACPGRGLVQAVVFRSAVADLAGAFATVTIWSAAAGPVGCLSQEGQVDGSPLLLEGKRRP